MRVTNFNFLFIGTFLAQSFAMHGQTLPPVNNVTDLDFVEHSYPIALFSTDFSQTIDYFNISGFIHGFVEDDDVNSEIYPTGDLIAPLKIKYHRTGRLCGYPTIRDYGDNPVFLPVLGAWWNEIGKIQQGKVSDINRCSNEVEHNAFYQQIENLSNWTDYPALGSTLYENEFKTYISSRLDEIDDMNIDPSDIIIDIWNEPNKPDSQGNSEFPYFSDVFIDLVQYIQASGLNYRIAGPSIKSGESLGDGLKPVDIDYLKDFLDDLVAHNDQATPNEKITLHVLSYHNFPHRGAVDQHKKDLDEIYDLLANNNYITKLGIETIWLGEHLGDANYDKEDENNDDLMNRKQHDDSYILSSYDYIQKSLNQFRQLNLDGMASRGAWSVKFFDQSSGTTKKRNPSYGAIGALLNHDFGAENLSYGKGWNSGKNGWINSTWVTHKLFVEMADRYAYSEVGEDDLIFFVGKVDNKHIRFLVTNNSNGTPADDEYSHDSQLIKISLNNLSSVFSANDELEIKSFSYNIEGKAIIDKNLVGNFDDLDDWYDNLDVDTNTDPCISLSTANLTNLEFVSHPNKVFCIDIYKK